MTELKENGKYSINDDMKSAISAVFSADYADQDETKATIKDVFNKYNYLMDTHTAVAYACSEKIPADAKRVILSTATL